MLHRRRASKRLRDTDRPLRVLHVLPDLAVGTQRFVLSLAGYVDPKRFEFHVAYLRDGDSVIAPATGALVEVTSLHHVPGWRAILTFVRLLRLIHRRQIDIVHTHSFLDSLFAHPAALLTGVPVVHTLNMLYEHAHDFRKRKSPIGRAFLRFRHSLRKWLERLVVKRYIAISLAVLASYAQILPDAGDRLTLVRYGVPTQKLAQPLPERELLRVRSDVGLEGCFPVLSSVGRLSIAQKDQLTLIRALPIVQEEFPRTRLLLVGEGKGRLAIEVEIERLGLGERVSLLGSREDVGVLLGASDIFAFPSRYEGFGIALVEAMAAGKPVVASRVAPLTEIVEEGASGYLVEPGNPAAFASAIGKLARDRTLAKAMGARGQQIARERFDIGRCARGWEGVYRSVLEGLHPGTSLVGKAP